MAIDLFSSEVARMRRDVAMIHRHDEATERMLASFARVSAQRKACGDDQEPAGQTQAEINAEELALFDRAEARAINSGAW